MLLPGALIFQSCDKEPIPMEVYMTYTVSIVKTVGGSVVADKTQGIAFGSTVNFKFTPDTRYSIYTIKINGKVINETIPYDTSFEYSYIGIEYNIYVEVSFVETNILILSVQEPAWMSTKIEKYRVKDDSYSHQVTQTNEQLSRKFYFLYPSMDMKVLNPDGSVYWQDKWNLINGIFTRGAETLVAVLITPEKIALKAEPVWSEYDQEYLYSIYTYERKAN